MIEIATEMPNARHANTQCFVEDQFTCRCQLTAAEAKYVVQ